MTPDRLTSIRRAFATCARREEEVAFCGGLYLNGELMEPEVMEWLRREGRADLIAAGKTQALTWQRESLEDAARAYMRAGRDREAG